MLFKFGAADRNKVNGTYIRCDNSRFFTIENDPDFMMHKNDRET